jgi:hypothetical protein
MYPALSQMTHLHENLTEQLGPSIMIFTCTQEVPNANLGHTLTIPTQDLHSFPQSPQTNARTVPQIRPQPLTSTFSPVHYLMAHNLDKIHGYLDIQNHLVFIIFTSILSVIPTLRPCKILWSGPIMVRGLPLRSSCCSMS